MRVRVKYHKGEEVKYVGHLDTMRTFIRCIKRTAIPVEYSKGFNPRVQISFALPLGVGVTSDSEFFDLLLSQKMNENILIGELNSVLPQGFKVLGVEYVGEDDRKSLMSLVKEAVYEITIKGNIEPERIKKLIEQDEIMIEKEGKEKNKKTIVNLKEYLLESQICKRFL